MVAARLGGGMLDAGAQRGGYPVIKMTSTNLRGILYPGPLFTHHVCMYGYTYSKSMDQPGRAAIPARGQLNREHKYFLVRVHA